MRRKTGIKVFQLERRIDRKLRREIERLWTLHSGCPCCSKTPFMEGFRRGLELHAWRAQRI